MRNVFLSLTVFTSLISVSTGHAEDRFAALKGIEAKPLSDEQLAEVRGQGATVYHGAGYFPLPAYWPSTIFIRFTYVTNPTGDTTTVNVVTSTPNPVSPFPTTTTQHITTVNTQGMTLGTPR